MKKQLANPPPTLHEYFTRFYYLESIIALWITIGLAVLVFGVLVHINLNFVIGVAMVLVGVAILGLTMVGAILWAVYGEMHLDHNIKARRILLGFKFSFIVVFSGLSIWASVVMIQRSL